MKEEVGRDSSAWDGGKGKGGEVEQGNAAGMPIETRRWTRGSGGCGPEERQGARGLSDVCTSSVFLFRDLDG